MSYKLRMKDLPKNERPREKILRYGAEAMSNSELLALILRTGTKDENILKLCDRVISHFGGINGLINLSPEDLKQVKGIGEAKASQIMLLLNLQGDLKVLSLEMNFQFQVLRI